MADMVSRRSFLTAVIIAALAVSASRAADPLPAELSDDSFWKLVTVMSEPDGQFRFENFLSNEIYYQTVIPRLKNNTRPGGVYLGVGPEQNFSYMVALQPKIAFIIDIRRQNMLELLMYKAIFELSADRADFLSTLFSRHRPSGLTAKSTAQQLFRAYSAAVRDPELYQQNIARIQERLLQKHQFGLTLADMQNIAYVHRVFADDGPYLDYSSGSRTTNPTRGMPTYAELMITDDGRGTNRSYLASEDNYKWMRDMELRNLVVPLVGDFAGPKTIRAIGQYLQDHNAKVSAFYLSNVEQYLYADGKLLTFFRNVETLPMDSSSMFIRTFGPNGGGAAFTAGNGFQSTLSSMMDVVKVCTAGRGCDYSVIRQMSR